MSFAQNTPQQTALYLRTLPAIRERCSRVHALATEGKLQYFDYHPEKEDDAADFCIDIIKVRDGPLWSNFVDLTVIFQRDFDTSFASVCAHSSQRDRYYSNMRVPRFRLMADGLIWTLDVLV